MNNFLKQTLASLVGTLFGLFIFAGVGTTGLLLLLFAAASSSSTGPVVKDKSVLVFDLSMNITEREPGAGEELQNRLSGVTQDRMTLRSVLDSLEKAKRDQRIVAIYLDGTRGGNNLGFASMKEIRKALEEFRKSGKKIIAYGVGWDERDYYLGSVADTVALNPLGELEINGLSSQPIFLAGALQKYGIGVQVVRVGKFKGAVEPLVLDKLSPENREQTQKLLDDVWSERRLPARLDRLGEPHAVGHVSRGG